MTLFSVLSINFSYRQIILYKENVHKIVQGKILRTRQTALQTDFTDDP